MTVGELVYQIATKDGYTPKFSDGFLSSLKNATEASQKMMETMKGPLANINSMMENLRPQMEAISKMSFPHIPMPSTLSIPSTKLEIDEDDETDLFIPALMRPVQDVRIVNYHEIEEAKSEVRVIRASYLLPINATWESLYMQFIDGHTVRVSYPNMKTEVFDYKDMGFLDGKTKKSPDIKWTLLQAIARHDGALTKDNFNRKLTRNVKYELNQRLKQFFGMKENPIGNYTKKNGYEASFTLLWDK
jgi:hypothetical protein